MTDIKLDLVENLHDIQQSLEIFNASFGEDFDLGRSLIRTTSYWVYDPISRKFGPSKFVGFKNMTLVRYQSARNGNLSDNVFDGHVTRKSIEDILGAYTEDGRLSVELVDWAVSLLGADALEGIDESKWRFVSL